MSEKELPGTLPTNFTDEGYARFEADWLARRSDEPPPRWQDYLPAPDAPCTTDLVLMLLMVDIEFRVKAGLPALLAEGYFEHPRLQHEDARLDAAQRMELIQWEYQQRWRNGQQARREEYEAAFPQHAEAVRQLKPLSRCPKCQKTLALEETYQTFVCPDCGGSPALDVSSVEPAELDLRGYQLIEKLGEGGMGEVYRSCDPSLGRDVVIKVIRADGQRHPEYVRRFLREARITGSLQHPGIVAIYNLGRLPDGRLHYTMRLVRGRTFADILKEEEGKPERLPSLLAIFEKVCEAVAYAHSKRVIHRDLKPHNIMVGKFGEVQVMDWGLAKLLTADEEEAESEGSPDVTGTHIHTEPAETPLDLTRGGSEFGSPPYMPPEQALGEWSLVDERADVFALGSILCEVLTGKPVYTGSNRNEVLWKAKRGDLAEALSRLDQCGADAALTALCRECLAVEYQQRPRNAGGVARRVADYTAEVEIRLRQAELERAEAQVKTREERKRRRLAVLLSAAVLLVFVVGTLISTLFAVDARRQADAAQKFAEAESKAKLQIQRERDFAEEARERAKQEADKSKTVLKELVHIFQLADPRASKGEIITAREILDRTSKRIPETFKDQLDTEAALLETIGNVYNSLGFLSDAHTVLQKSLAIRRKLLGEEHPDTASSYNSLALNLNAQGKYWEAEKGFRNALDVREKILGEEHPDTARSHNSLALNLNAQGKYWEAEDGFRKALAIFRKVLGEEHPDTAASYNNVAVNLQSQGRYREAEEGHSKGLAIRRKVLGEEHPDTAASYSNVASNLNAQGKYREAEEGYRKALAIRRKVLGEEHPDTATSYRNVADNLDAQGKYTDAESFFLRAADSFAKSRLHVSVTGLERAAFTSELSPLMQLAALLARIGKPDDAWQRFEESLARGTWDDLNARLRQPQAKRDKQAKITARIDRLNLLISKTDAEKRTPEQTKQRNELLSQLRLAYDELSAFNQQLEKTYGPIAGQPFSRSKIQTLLPADTALLAWLDIPGHATAADPNGEHWAIVLRSAGPPIWVRLSGSGDKDAWTDADTQLPSQLREALQSSRDLWQPLAERLRKQRLDPLAQHLKGVRQLIVLPSTALAGVPLEVIADKYTVSYAPSGTLYAFLRQQPPLISKGLLALADPVFQTPALADKPQPLPPAGVLLTVVVPGSNAAKAGLNPNDVLLRYGDTALNGPADFKPLPESSDPDRWVQVVVWRDGATLKQEVHPGKLGIAIAKEPAPQALAEQRRKDHWLRSISRGGDEVWQELPGTQVEAAALQRLFGTSARVLLRSEASEQRLNELAASGELGKYRYIHLATHSNVDKISPLRSALILSRDHLPDEKERTELLLAGKLVPGGRISAMEILRQWNLNCDLVTLSACETALGKYEQGEGFLGFAQALILCGTRSVCLSLWKVDDTTTALLMERFYQNLLGKRDGLKAPMPKAEALQEAKSWLRTLPGDEVLKRAAALTESDSRGKPTSNSRRPAVAKAKPGDCPFAHPHYWAAFILIGNSD
ncbi:MAG: tetratricopeptide repeat protein [Gemmataceae bacterium]